MMNVKRKLYILLIVLILLVMLFLIIGLNSYNWKYALSRRIPKIMAIILIGSSISFSSTLFQTITNNRILTPSVLGLDSLYMFIQTFIVFVFGSMKMAYLGKNFNFLVSVILMVLFSVIIFLMLFKKKNNIFFLLLFGMVFGTLFQSLTSFMQVLIDPNEFLVIQNRSFVSFNNINMDLLWIAIIGVFLTAIYIFRHIGSLDVMSLGRDNAISLGVNYDVQVKRVLIVVAVLVSISTALVGPITFLGLLVINISREFIKTYKHKYLIPGSMLIGSIILVGGQLIAERIMKFETPIGVVINFLGGIYFIYLILREGKAI